MSKEPKKYVVVYKVGLVPQIKVLEVLATSKYDAVVSTVNNSSVACTIVSVERLKE
jgi:beta-lactamase regulating signal transducer with metallopeptidase domain